MHACLRRWGTNEVLARCPGHHAHKQQTNRCGGGPGALRVSEEPSHALSPCACARRQHNGIAPSELPLARGQTRIAPGLRRDRVVVLVDLLLLVNILGRGESTRTTRRDMEG